MTPSEAQDLTVALVAELAVRAGKMPSPFSLNGRSIRSALLNGIPLAHLRRHYSKLIDALGGDVFRWSHGQYGDLPAKKLKDGTLADGLATGAYTRDLIKQIRAAGRELPQ